MSNSAISFNTSGLATTTSPGLVGTGAQTFAGKKTLDGGALIKGDTSGVAIASGYVGQIIPAVGLVDPGTITTGSNINITGTMTLTAGIYQIFYGAQIYQYGNHNNTSDYARGGGVRINLFNQSTDIDFLLSTVIVPYTPSQGGSSIPVKGSTTVVLNGSTNYNLRYNCTTDGSVTFTVRQMTQVQLYAVRIA